MILQVQEPVFLHLRLALPRDTGITDEVYMPLQG